ncbi:hypothetical protein AMECASPLE_008140 [Ameca splendens]|uniref:Secreted protein n=1 Tax=Ameca splendens TaxID=208324 RepID=A0ABV0ZX09_9TELE
MSRIPFQSLFFFYFCSNCAVWTRSPPLSPESSAVESERLQLSSAPINTTHIHSLSAASSSSSALHPSCSTFQVTGGFRKTTTALSSFLDPNQWRTGPHEAED